MQESWAGQRSKGDVQDVFLIAGHEHKPKLIGDKGKEGNERCPGAPAAVRVQGNGLGRAERGTELRNLSQE